MFSKPAPPPTPPTWLTLDPGLDPVRLGEAFAPHGRIHIPDVLAPGAADRLYRSLHTEVPWRRSTDGPNGNMGIYVTEFDKRPEAWRRQFLNDAYRKATRDFQYLFDNHPISDELELGRRSGIACEAAYDVMNAEPFLDFIRRLTGEPACAYVDVQATRYMPGHFLTRHDDNVAGKHRLFAYVLNLTPVWSPDWGGLLNFYSPENHVAEGYTPRFNALNLFRTPAFHSVTQVANFAGAARYAISGWIRSRAPWDS